MAAEHPQKLEYMGPTRAPAKYEPDSEEIRWQRQRIALRTVLVVAVFAGVFFFARNFFLYGKFTPLTAADYIPDVQRQGVPIVRAMKRYQRDTGQLPKKGEDLVPKYLQTWSHTHSGPGGLPTIWNGEFSLNMFRFHEQVRYDFTPGSEGWLINGPVVRGRIPLPPVIVSSDDTTVESNPEGEAEGTP